MSPLALSNFAWVMKLFIALSLFTLTEVSGIIGRFVCLNYYLLRYAKDPNLEPAVDRFLAYE